MANLPKAVQAIAKLIQQYMLKRKTTNVSTADVIRNISNGADTAKIWNKFPTSIKKTLLKKWGITTAHDKGVDILINGNADQLKTYITKTQEGRKWIQVVDKKGISGAGKQYTNRSFALNAAGKAAEVASKLALVYAIDEGVETLQNIPGLGYVLNQTSIGPWLLHDAIAGAIPGIGDFMTSVSHGLASFFAGVLDFIGLDGMANWLKEYNRVYDDKQIANAAVTEQRKQAMFQVFESLKDVKTAEGTSNLYDTLRNDGFKQFIKESFHLAKNNEDGDSDQSSNNSRDNVSIWVSELMK